MVFNPAHGFKEFPVTVPCGKCDGCRLEYARQWAVRCMHEASLKLENCFVTLTFDEEHLPPGSSLLRHRGRCDCPSVCKTFPGFMKRLRKDLHGMRVRYFHCGEYGEKSGRPHYHALLFGCDFGDDRKEWTVRGGFPVWRSARLERLWPFGLSEIGNCSVEAACYVARYVVKKQVGPLAWRNYASVDADGVVTERAREYTTMSRRPGIGMRWIAEYLREVYPSDRVVVRGQLRRPPRAYDKELERRDPEAFEALKWERVQSIDELEGTPERLAAREAVVIARTRMERGL